VVRLEDGDLPLDDALALYARGQAPGHALRAVARTG
jgi:exonuclease VII small subunit